jgi:acyl dehydratase
MADSRTGRYFEDYAVGVEQVVGNVSLSETEMIDFASKYDPQDFHVDPKKAAEGPYGGLIASGWHTASAAMRLLVDRYLNSASSLGSPGLDELRWLAPVRPGDVLTVRAKVLDARRSNSKPDRGLIHTWIEVFNQDGVTVMTMKAVNVIACRDAE